VLPRNISAQPPIVESKARPREIAAHCNSSLPISIHFVYSFQIIVPVVQRKEQMFPKTKLAFYHTSSAIVSVIRLLVRRSIWKLC